MSNSSQSTRPIGRLLWKELLEGVILHITPLCSLLQTPSKDKCMCLQDEWKLKVTCPAGQVQYWNILSPAYLLFQYVWDNPSGWKGLNLENPSYFPPLTHHYSTYLSRWLTNPSDWEHIPYKEQLRGHRQLSQMQSSNTRVKLGLSETPHSVSYSVALFWMLGKQSPPQFPEKKCLIHTVPK